MAFQIRALVLALQFLTRLPLPPLLKHEDHQNGRLAGQSVVYYPVAGLLIGLLLALTPWTLGQFSFEASASLLTAAIVLAVWIALTGALHLDGLADSADAWLGGMGDPQRTLDIMKDPRSGPAGVVSIVVVLIIKFAALASLLHDNWLLLLLAPMLARSAVVALFLTTPYARRNGMGEQAALNTPRHTAWLVVILSAVLAIALAGEKALLALALVALVWTLQRRRMTKRIGGMTGDTAGEMIETIETVVLVGLVVG